MRLLVAFAVFCVCAVSSGWLVVQALATAMPGAPPKLGLDDWLKRVPRAEALALDSERERIVFIGDSTTEIPVGAAIPITLERTLAARRRPIDVAPLGFSGMNAFDYYFLAEPLVATRPTRLVMNLNAAAYSDGFRQFMMRPELAAWIPPRRWAESALLPFHWLDLTYDELIMGSLVVQSGGARAWRSLAREGVRLRKGYEKLSLAAQGADVSFRGPFTPRMLWTLTQNGKIKRDGPEPWLERYGVALEGVAEDHPMLALTEAAVAIYVEAGIPVTAYASPIDVERMQALGIDTGPGLRTTIDRMRAAVEAGGGQFVDLHDLLRSRHFLDPGGHVTAEGATRVARQLARVVQADAARSARRNR